MLYLVRHGKTKLNGPPSQDRIRGWQDVPLDDTGKAQAKATGRAFKNVPLDKIYSSDLSRAVDTANEVSKRTGAPVEKTPELRPWNLGKYQGEKIKDVDPAIADLAKNKPDQPVDGGESFSDFANRALDKFTNIQAEAKDKNIAVVTHVRNINLIKGYLKANAAKI